MTKESAKSFLDKLENDAEFKNHIVKCQSTGELKEFLKNQGYSFTREEVKVILEERVGHELSDEEMVRLAAGGSGAGDTPPPVNIYVGV